MHYSFRAINLEQSATRKAYLINFLIRVHLLNALNFNYKTLPEEVLLRFPSLQNYVQVLEPYVVQCAFTTWYA